MYVIQKFECYITNVYNDTFKATLIDLTLPNNNLDEIVTFKINIIKETKRHLIVKGSFFHWSIYSQGQSFDFIDTGRYSKKELLERENKAKEIMDSLNII